MYLSIPCHLANVRASDSSLCLTIVHDVSDLYLYLYLQTERQGIRQRPQRRVKPLTGRLQQNNVIDVLAYFPHFQSTLKLSASWESMQIPNLALGMWQWLTIVRDVSDLYLYLYLQTERQGIRQVRDLIV